MNSKNILFSALACHNCKLNLLVTEHHITVIAFDGLDFSMSRIDMPFQMIGFHKRSTTF